MKSSTKRHRFLSHSNYESIIGGASQSAPSAGGVARHANEWASERESGERGWFSGSENAPSKSSLADKAAGADYRWWGNSAFVLMTFHSLAKIIPTPLTGVFHGVRTRVAPLFDRRVSLLMRPHVFRLRLLFQFHYSRTCAEILILSAVRTELSFFLLCCDAACAKNALFSHLYKVGAKSESGLAPSKWISRRLRPANVLRA